MQLNYSILTSGVDASRLRGIDDKPSASGGFYFMGKKVDYGNLAGVKFYYLTFVKALPVQDRWRKVELVCVCGNVVIANWDNVRRGKTKSCGCKRFPTGEMVKHPLQKILTGIKQRCNNPNSPAYKYYGAIGVKICKEWEVSFEPFYKWCMENGWKQGLEVDKDIKGNGKLYSPEWCSIITHRENTLAIKRKPKLTKAIADEILNSPLSGRQLAKEMKITRHVITAVRNNRYWQRYK